MKKRTSKRSNKVANNVTATKSKRKKLERTELPEGWEMTFDENTNRFNLSFPMEPKESESGISTILASAKGKFNVPVDFQDEEGNDLEVTMYGLGVYAKVVE